MPANDPYYEEMTVKGQVKKRIIAIWPSIYKLTNYFFFQFVNSIKAIIRIAKQSIWPK